MPDEKRITVSVTPELHAKVKAKAALLGKSISDVVREYLEAVAGDVVLPAAESKEEAKD
jgi:predicted HicB family RNase H-like nuclease